MKMPKYDLLIDGERQERVGSEQEVRDWLATYRAKHTEDDPGAAHVQIVRLRLLGGKLIPREQFF